MPAQNPLAHPALAGVLALDPAFQAEARVQSLLAIWFTTYFTGVPFTTRAIDGGTQQRTFQSADIIWQEAAIDEKPQKPVIHILAPDRRSKRGDYRPAAQGHTDTWFFDLFVKVPPSLAGTGMAGDRPADIAADLAGQAEWLLNSSEREAVEEHGIFRLQVERPPVILPSSAWLMRMLSFSCQVRREYAR